MRMLQCFYSEIIYLFISFSFLLATTETTKQPSSKTTGTIIIFTFSFKKRMFGFICYLTEIRSTNINLTLVPFQIHFQVTLLLKVSINVN